MAAFVVFLVLGALVLGFFAKMTFDVAGSLAVAVILLLIMIFTRRRRK